MGFVTLGFEAPAFCEQLVEAFAAFGIAAKFFVLSFVAPQIRRNVASGPAAGHSLPGRRPMEAAMLCCVAS